MSRTRTPKYGLTAVLALVVSSLAIAPAPATTYVPINSKIIMRPNAPAFHGKVKSKKEACVQNRLVKLFKKKRSGVHRRLLGKTHTDSAGKWAVIVDPLSSGVYRAVVRPRLVADGLCLSDKSQRRVID